VKAWVKEENAWILGPTLFLHAKPLGEYALAHLSVLRPWFIKAWFAYKVDDMEKKLFEGKAVCTN